MTAATVADPDLPVLAVLSDPERLAALLYRVPWLAGPRAAEAVLRLRWKPGTNVRAGVLVPTATGPAALLVADFGVDDGKADRLAGQVGRRGRPVLRDGGLVVAPAASDPVLRRWVPKGLAPLAYNPDRRIVGRVGSSVVKVHAAPPSQAVRDLASRTVAAEWPDRHVSRSPWVAGRPPESGDGAAVTAALASLHGMPAPAGLPVLTAGDALAAAEDAAEAVAATLPHLAERLHRLTDALDEAASAGWPDADVVVHGDLSADQVLVRPDGTVALLDLDRAALGPAGWDGATWGAAEIATGGGRPAPIAAAPVLQAMALLQRAPEPFRRLRADWPALTEALVAAAEHALDPPRAVASRRRGTGGGPGAACERVVGAGLPVGTGAPLAAALDRLPAGLVARRAWPAGADLAVEAATAAAPGLAGVVVAPDSVRVQVGTDTKLPALAAELARPGAELIGHRPGKRAVLRRPVPGGTEYVKVVRPGRAATAADGLRSASRIAAGTGELMCVPEVCAVDDAAGIVRLAALPGPTLHQLLVDGSARAVVTAARVGAVLTALAAARPDVDLAHHDAAAEIAVVDGWAGAAARWGGPDLREATELVGAALRGLPARPPVVAHRDLHDKQVVAAGPAIGLLDLDTLCLADPALDRGNLLAHLQLRVFQGRCDPRLAAACAARLHPLGGRDRAVVVHAAAALVRLAAVYTFRPGPRGLPELLLTAALDTLPAAAYAGGA